MFPYESVKHTEDIVLRLLRIREARRLSESPLASSEDVQVLRSFIIENRRQIPSFALSHFDRLEAGGTPGLAAVENGRCSSCGTAVPRTKSNILKKQNIGVCDGCFASSTFRTKSFATTDFQAPSSQRMKITDIPFRPKILSCMKSYSRSSFFADLNAGVSVGILALPLAMAFAIASGVAPEQGLYTAIVAGFIISVFGGSKVQIGGPTGAFIVVVAGIISQYGYGALAVATVMAGAILVAMGLAKMGNAIRYIPRPVTVGFTNGIAVLIMSTQIKDFLGLEMRNVPEDFIPKLAAIWENIHTADWRTLLVGVASAVIIVYWPKLWRRRVPGMIGAIFILTPLVALSGFDVETIRARFGGIPSSLPSFAVPEFEFPK